MNFKIITDSSADISSLEDIAFAEVPLKIITTEKEYIDDASLDVHAMLEDLKTYKGKSGSSCPSVGDWKDSFGNDADAIFCITITSGLSGSNNTANIAAREFAETYPDRKIHVIDSLSTGPESALIIEKLRELILEGRSFEDIVDKITRYGRRTHLAFSLECLHNLANNGRVSPLVAKVAGILGIRVVGKASDEGTLEMTEKAPGAARAIAAVIDNMKKNGYKGGRVRIHHCENPGAVEKLKDKLLALFPSADIVVRPTKGLCSFYAERGGMLIGFEGSKKAGAKA